MKNKARHSTAAYALAALCGGALGYLETPRLPLEKNTERKMCPKCGTFNQPHSKRCEVCKAAI